MPVVGLILHNVLSKYFHTKNNNLGDGKNQESFFPSKFHRLVKRAETRVPKWLFTEAP